MLSNTQSSNTVSFTCLTCNVHFENNDAQRAHYKNDWHKYNLKRKIASLPILTENEFNEMFNEEKSKTTYNCDICNKIFHNENTLKDHKVSKKHRENLSIFQKNKYDSSSDDDESSIDSSSNDSIHPKESKINWKKKFAEAKTDDDFNKILQEKIENSKKIEETECLFCDFKCESFEAKMKHIKNIHSFYIPDLEFLSDIKGLINYLSEKISIGNTCIYCDKIFNSLEAIRKHMLDKGHTKIRYEEGPDLEIANFYDFSCLYDECEEKNCDYENDDINCHALTITSEGTELILPSGAHIGHRDYKRYYNQNLHDHLRNNCRALMTVTEKYKALGYYNIGSSGMTIEKERIEKMKEIRQSLIKYSQDRETLGEKNNSSFIAYGRLGSFRKVFLR